MKKVIGVIIIIFAAVFLIATLRKPNKEVDTYREEIQDEATFSGEDEIDISSFENKKYAVNTQDSSVEFIGRGIGKSHTGTILVQEGNVSINDADISGQLTFDMSSIVSDSSGLDEDLKSPNFFDVETYPTAVFVITGYNTNEIQGDLTIRDITQDVSFPVTLSQENDQLSIDGNIVIDRTRWDITYRSENFFAEIGDKAIADDINLDIKIIADSTLDAS